jgi:AcrR family transcriptional regulator
MPSGTAQTRPYLRAGERRSQLLEAAAAVVGREGLSGLTIAGVAMEAGVSRQWIYEHFSDLDDLYRALILDRFASLDATIEAATRRLTGTELVTFAARQVFALAPADRQILRTLVDGGGRNSPELADIESELRERIFRRWTGLVRTFGHDEPEARAIVWAIVNALFGLADRIERDSLAVEKAVSLLEVLVQAFTESRFVEQPSTKSSTVAHDIHQQGTGALHAH